MAVLAFDTETKGLDWWNPAERAFLVTWATAHDQRYADLDDAAQVGDFVSAVKALQSGDAIVGHYVKFDIHQVRETIGFDILAFAEERGIEIWDTDIMSRILHPEGQNKNRAGHSLKNLATIYLRADAQAAEEHLKELAKSIGHRTLKKTGVYWDLYRAYPDAVIRYALDDARFTWDLYQLFVRELAAAPEGTQRVMELEREVTPLIVRGEQRGVMTDQEQVKKFKREFTAHRNELFARIANELGEEALGGEGSEDALIEGLLGIGIPLTERTPSGDKLSTAKKVLEPFAHDFPVINDLLEFRRVERFLGTYIGAVDGVEVVHADFQQCEAWTGRMSCRRPNMQNWPQRAGKEVRAVFIPRPGYAFLVSDYDTLEVRLLAYYLGDPTFRQMIADGHDAHAWTAASIWGGEPHDWRKDGPKAEGEESRKTARHTLFATMYGAGARKVSQQLGLDPGPYWGPDHPKIVAARNQGRRWPQAGYQYAAGRSLVAKLKSALPNYNHLMQRLRNKVLAVGHVNTIYGRRNPVSKDKSYVAMSALVQGSGADIIKLALVAASAALKPYGGTVLMTVHDEIVAEVPIEQAEAALPVMEDAMRNVLEMNPPLDVKGSVTTTNYAEA